MLSFLLFACSMKSIEIATVDAAENDVCVLQLKDEKIIHVESALCASLREGDVVKVIRTK